MNKNTTLFLLLGAAAAAYFLFSKKSAASGDVVSQLEAKGYTLTEKQKQLVRDIQSGKVKLESLTPAQQQAYRTAVLGEQAPAASTNKTVRTFEKAGDAARTGKDVYEAGKVFVDVFKTA